MSYLSVRALGLDRVAEAYPLANLGIGGLSPEIWQRFASQRILQSEPLAGGILTAQDQRDSIIGLASYLVKPDLRRTPSLLVDHLFAVGILERQRETALSVLLESLHDVARDHRCAELDIHLESSISAQVDSTVLELLRRRGHREKGLTFSKSFELQA